MKAVLAAVATAAVLSGAAWANNLTPSNLASLTKRVATLERSHAQLLDYVNTCVHSFQPVSQYGGHPTEGYVYTRDDLTTYEYQSALDVTERGQSPNFWFAYADQDCSRLTP